MDHLKLINENNDINKMKEKLEILSKGNHEEEIVMYIIVNISLKMKEGKIANQC